MKNKLNLLGLAQSAGKVISGEDLVIKAVQNGQAQLVFLASDCGESTRKKVNNKCLYYDVPVIADFTMIDISQALGKKRSIVCLIDKGFAKSFMNKRNQSGAKSDMRK